MPNEIYHRSNFGNPNAEGFGDVYYDHAATNKLYNHSDYYENSDGTDATLKDLNNKASIVLTPTAYSDGSLNTVIPPYKVLPTELVTNGNFETDSDWTKGSGWSISDGKAVRTGADSTALSQSFSALQNKKFRLSFEVSDWTVGHLKGYFYGGGGSDEFFDNTSIGNGSFTFEVTTTINRTNFAFLAYGSFDGSIDNVSVKEIQEADFDFSRGSSATRVNEQGLVEDVQILSGELVQNGNFEQIGAEEVTNGNFDTDTDWSKGAGWTISGGKAVATNTSSFFKQNSVVTNNKIYKVTFNATVDSGRFRLVTTADAGTYTSYITADGSYTFYMKPTVSINGGFEFVGDGYTGTIDNVSVKEVGQNWSFGTGWSMGDGKALFDSSGNAGYLTQSGALEINKKYKLTATVNSGIVSLVGAFYDVEQGQQIQTGVDSIFTVKSANGSVLRLYSHPNDGDAEITDIKVVEITDDTDLPRIDFTDGTGSLLLEPQSTNKVTQSETFSTWSTISSIITTTNILAPDGSTSVVKISSSNTTNQEHKIRFFTDTNSTTDSIFAKMGEVRYIYSRRLAGQWQSVVFDLQDGVIAANNYTTGAYPKITDYGNGWYRCEVNYTGLGTNETGWGLSDGLNENYNPSNTTDGLYVWGAQQEDLSFSTSYIPTESASVTRSADVANNSGNADLFNDSEGVLYAEIAALADTVTANHSISISDGSFANTMYIYFSSGDSKYGFAVFSGSSLVCNIKSDTVSFSQNAKIAAKFKQDDFALYLNGTQVATDTSGNTPSGLSSLQFDRGDGQTNFYGKTKCVAVFKEALSNDLLERLTGEGYESFRLLAEANNYTII